MSSNDLTEYIKKAFENKNDCNYKEAIDYFYKALAIDNDSCEIMCELAFLYEKLHQYDRAISFYEQVLSRKPDDYDTRFTFAMLYKKLQNLDKSQEQLEILYNINYNIIKTTEELFCILYNRKMPDEIIKLYTTKSGILKSSIIYYYVGWAYSAIGNNDIAEEFFEKSFAENENNIEAGSKIAYNLFVKGLFLEAEDLLNKLLQYSENDKIFYILAELKYLKSDLDSAIRYYNLAIKLNDKNAEYFYKLGVIFSLKGFIKDAEENYCRAITIEPDNVLYNYTLAYLYYMTNRKALAQRVISYILSLNGDYLAALSLNLLIMVDLNDISGANKILLKISENQNKDEFTYYSLAIYYSKLNLWNKAIENITKAILLKPESCEYKFELSKYYYNIKDYINAENTLELLISINEKYIEGYILLAKIFIDNNRTEEALQQIEKALTLDLNKSEIYYIRGKIYEKEAKYAEAVNDFKTAISMSPDNVEYYITLAKCYYNNKEYDCAYMFLKEAADIDVVNGEIRYLMAKCCEQNDDEENTLVNYSLAKRLSPQNILYVKDYATYLYNIKNKKGAKNLLKSSIKQFFGEEKIELEQLMQNLK